MEFEQMDQVAQFGLIAAIGDGALKGRIDALAEQAARIDIFAFSTGKGNGGRGLSADRAI